MCIIMSKVNYFILSYILWWSQSGSDAQTHTANHFYSSGDIPTCLPTIGLRLLFPAFLPILQWRSHLSLPPFQRCSAGLLCPFLLRPICPAFVSCRPSRHRSLPLRRPFAVPCASLRGKCARAAIMCPWWTAFQSSRCHEAQVRCENRFVLSRLLNP